MGFSAGGSQFLFEMTRFAGHTEQLLKHLSRHTSCSPESSHELVHGHGRVEAFSLNISSAVGCDGDDLACLDCANFSTL
jgi:hypothetical protein